MSEKRITSRDGSAFVSELDVLSQSSRDTWYSDCGASDHISCRREWFDEYEELPEKSWRIRIGNDGIMYAVGKGNIRIKALVGNDWISHVIHDVLHVPECPKNLFSVGTTADKGMKFEYDNSTVKIVNQQQQVEAIGIREKDSTGRMYRMLFVVVPPAQSHAHMASTSC